MTVEQKDFIELLYLELYERLRIYACTALENEALAEEAVQETFRTACMKPEALWTSPNPHGWLYQTLKNTIRNIRKTRANAQRLLVEYTAMHGGEVAYSEDQVRLEMIYGELSCSEEFRLLKEFAVDGRSHLEMAEKRGISVEACKKRVQRAKEFLRKKI